ncbi:MAG: hypothetical protein JO071_06525, partial [Deltaproteobacteria bacterium]|nr:hypothetical protein [Deltaproteobacteria bacterium]
MKRSGHYALLVIMGIGFSLSPAHAQGFKNPDQRGISVGRIPIAASKGGTGTSLSDFVKAGAFGFVGDGITNNDNAMTALLADMRTNHHSVIFPPGTFVLTNTNQIDLNSNFNGLIFQGSSGGNPNTTGLCSTVLKFSSNAAPGTITAASESGNLVTFTSTANPAVGSFGVVEGLTNGSYNAIGYLVNTTGGTSFTAYSSFSGLSSISSQSGKWYTALPFVIDNAENLQFRDMCFQGVGTEGSDGNQIMFSVIAVGTSGNNTRGGQAYWKNIDVKGVSQAWVVSGDISLSSWEDDSTHNVGSAIYGGFNQASQMNVLDATFACDAGGYGCIAFDNGFGGLKFFGGYVTDADATQAGEINFHWLSTFNGNVQPNILVGTHLEVYGSGTMLFKDDASYANAPLYWYGGDFSGDTNGLATNPLVVLYTKQQMIWDGVQENTGGPPLSTVVTMDTDSNANNSQANRPASLVVKNMVLQSGDNMPTVQLCTLNSAPPSGCSTYTPSQGINDNNMPKFCQENVEGYVGNQSGIGQPLVELRDFCTNPGTSAVNIGPVSGGIVITKLTTPSGLSCTCSPGGSATIHYEVAAADATGDTGGNKGWSPWSASYACTTAHETPLTGGHSCTLTWTPSGGAQYYEVA